MFIIFNDIILECSNFIVLLQQINIHIIKKQITNIISILLNKL